jgi:hypothetical protein
MEAMLAETAHELLPSDRFWLCRSRWKGDR